KNISVTEADHPRISADPGVFFDGSGQALEADEDAQAGSSSPSSTSTETDDGQSSDSASTEAEDHEAFQVADETAAGCATYDLSADSSYELSATRTTPDVDVVDLSAEVTVGDPDASPMSLRPTLADDQPVGLGALIILNFGSPVSQEF